MDLGWMKFGYEVAVTLVNLIGWAWMYLTNRNKVTNARIGQLETDIGGKMDAYGNRLTRLEQEVQHSPTHDDLGKLYQRMNGLEQRLGDRIETVNGSIKRVEGENASQTRILNLVYESLITRGKHD